MLKAGVHIIVATPGRLIDLMERKVAKLETIAAVSYTHLNPYWT